MNKFTCWISQVNFDKRHNFYLFLSRRTSTYGKKWLLKEKRKKEENNDITLQKVISFTIPEVALLPEVVTELI